MPGALVATGDRVTLRTVESEDLAFVQRSRANPEIRRGLGNPLTSRTTLEADDPDDDGHDLLVCIDGDEAGPGAVDEEGVRRDFMFVDGEHRDMVCYGLAREDWGRGE